MVLAEPVHCNDVTTILPPAGSIRVVVKLTVASTSIEFGPCPLAVAGSSYPKASGDVTKVQVASCDLKHVPGTAPTPVVVDPLIT